LACQPNREYQEVIALIQAKKKYFIVEFDIVEQHDLLQVVRVANWTLKGDL
jgi:hypothetical protein